MKDIEILGNAQKGDNFIKKIKKKNFLFSFVISYTETCEIPGITVAGEHPDLIKYTPPADAEFLHYGHCKSINVVPMTPDGQPTPAILTKVALEAASIPSIVVNAGSKIPPKLPCIDLGLKPGKNIALE
ncbi:MAG: nicotinate mononucleotide-dependent phosphoribosyltransferase CobT, partial [Nitrosopumilaceae archaeon]